MQQQPYAQPQAAPMQQQYQPQPQSYATMPMGQDPAAGEEHLQKTPTGMHPMVVLQPGERIICTVKRHPFGIVSLYVAAVIGMLIAVVLAVVLVPNALSQAGLGSDNSAMIYAGMAIVIVALILILGLATSVYWQNEWVVTSDSITQISQTSLFTRQVSQLSMDNLEDVTVDQNGILPHLFGFGTLKVETAGERSKFQFPYCPRPNDYARKILEVHEEFLEMRRNVQNHGITYTNNG